jgi:hypothetical protein
MKKLKIGFIGNFEVPFSTENDRAWSFEKLGHKVVKFQENITIVEDLMTRIDDIDVFFYSHTHGWEINLLTEFFDHCKKRGVPTASVHLDRWAWLTRESDVGNEATWFTEYLFMADGSPEAKELYEKNGITNWHWIKPGVLERDCYIAGSDRQRFPHDVIFVGSRGYHPEYPFRAGLIDWLTKTYGEKFGHYGGDGAAGGTIRQHDLNVLYASAKVVVGDSCFGNRPYYWSDRVTETIGRGGFLLHPANQGLYIEGMATYETGNLHNLKTNIDFWLQNDEIREQHRQKSHKWVKQNETYTQRAEEMLKVVFGNK